MRSLEAIFWTAGTLLVLMFFGAHVLGEKERQRAVADFSSAETSERFQFSVLAGSSYLLVEEGLIPPTAEQTREGDGKVLAVLRASSIGLELPVRYGTEERVLRQGPGLIEGTAWPGSNGNVAIAAHRDIHFRGLKDLEVGDMIELAGSERTISYKITDLSVVDPTDIHVLDEIGKPVLTLVTCYPFYFVGNAPKRFIVRAESVDFFQ